MTSPFDTPHYGDHNLIRKGTVAALIEAQRLMAAFAIGWTHPAARAFAELLAQATNAEQRAAALSYEWNERWDGDLIRYHAAPPS